MLTMHYSFPVLQFPAYLLGVEPENLKDKLTGRVVESKWDHTLSCTIMKRNLSHSFRDKTNVEVILTSPEALNDLIRLYYGARCVFAHGQPDRTLGPGGVLHKLPEETGLTKKVGVKSVSCRLSTLCQNLQNYGRYA